MHSDLLQGLPNRLGLIISLFLVCLLSIVSSAQQSSYPIYPQRTSAAPDSMSRAEQEAEQLVSLSADKIITMLNDEPGLLLEVKKTLVRKAYEQGRILNPEDLTDEALFRLISNDINIRVMVTREIENRMYVRAKPTHAELERDRQMLQARGVSPSANALSAEQKTAGGENQEDVFWAEHDRLLDSYPAVPNPATQTPGPNTPAAPQQQAPVLPYNSPRAVERTELDYSSPVMGMGGFGDTAGGLDGMYMQRVSPDQLSGALAARMASAGSGDDELGTSAVGGGSGMLPISMASQSAGIGAAGTSSLTGGLTNPFLNQSFGSSSITDQYLYGGQTQQAGSSQQYPMQANLRMPRPPVRPSVADLGLDRPMLARRPNPYADVPSLFDLYTQYSSRPPVLERFGAEIFRNGTGNFDMLPMDVPVGPDYVLGPGDSLTVSLWGGVSQRLIRIVDREGRISLPEAGVLQVSGRTLGDVQQVVQSSLRSQFRDVRADVSISRIRSVRVYVVGDVERPGPYDVSSLSTPVNALVEAGGPTSRGSLRTLKHYRGNQLIQEVDVYDLLLHGVHGDMRRLESGDTIMVPPLGPEITIAGMVRRPGIYELNGEQNLAAALELAGGVLPSGTLRHVDLERLESHENRSMLALDIPENNNSEAVTKALEDFKIQDGDKVKISPIVSYADKSVFLDGHVYRPGKYAYQEGMKLTDLIKSYKDLLPEPYKAHAEIIRLNAPDYTPEVLAFNLDDALAGKQQDLVLKPLDTVRIFGRYDFEDPPVITVTGAVRDPGDHVTNGATYLRDAIFLAGNANSDAELDDVQVFRHTEDGQLKVLSADLSKALAGDATQNLLLEPKDRVFVHKNLAKTDPPTVTIEGEVARPGKYPLGENMSAADLVRLAGGLKRSAYTQEADLTRFEEEQGSKIVSDHVDVPIAKALANEPDADVRLRDGDVLTIRQLTGWADMGATIRVEGEVVHPGVYGIQQGERLSSILQRAGGFTKNAYLYGAVFERVQVRQMEIQNRTELIRRVKSEAAEAKLTPAADQEDSKQAILLQYDTTLEKLEHTNPAGRMVIHISSNVKAWANTLQDIQVRNGDSIFIPKHPNIVIVNGSVYNPTAITYKPGKDTAWYLKQSGGPTGMANKKAVFVVRADGSVIGGGGGMFSGGVEKAELRPGDMIIVPERTFSISHKFQNTVQAAQIATAITFAVTAARSF
jgi:protein involved in polysaccharide export with SLBB domain